MGHPLGGLLLSHYPKWISKTSQLHVSLLGDAGLSKYAE